MNQVSLYYCKWGQKSQDCEVLRPKDISSKQLICIGFRNTAEKEMERL